VSETLLHHSSSFSAIVSALSIVSTRGCTRVTDTVRATCAPRGAAERGRAGPAVCRV
jgi:hypothetical protein